MPKFEVPNLPYEFNALEPYISAQIMTLHHDKHHVGYVKNLNAAIDKHPEWGEKSIEEIIKGYASAPEDIRTALRNHGGGHYNHSLFWNMLTPSKDQAPAAPLADAISKQFGSLDGFKTQFTESASKVFGSGWCWLVLDGASLAIATTPNQDSPLTQGKIPILGVDVWEHAYYLQYMSDRAKYLENWWHVVNWEYAAKRLEEAKK